MTIKEIEERSGLARANIRFYEAEGLLAPERKPNGYRDYLEGDLQTLLRVRLLRSLGVTLEDIKAIQNGALSLPEALSRHLEHLAGERDRLDRAEAVCREKPVSSWPARTAAPLPSECRSSWKSNKDPPPVSWFPGNGRRIMFRPCALMPSSPSGCRRRRFCCTTGSLRAFGSRPALPPAWPGPRPAVRPCKSRRTGQRKRS